MIGGFILPRRQPLLNQQHIHLPTFFCRCRVWIVPRIGETLAGGASRNNEAKSAASSSCRESRRRTRPVLRSKRLTLADNPGIASSEAIHARLLPFSRLASCFHPAHEITVAKTTGTQPPAADEFDYAALVPPLSQSADHRKPSPAGLSADNARPPPARYVLKALGQL